MSANRNAYTTLRDAAGNERGVNVTASNALVVDGSAVTQPISAASLPLPSTAATSTKQSDGTQKTQIVDGSGNVIASTTNSLNVQCANCSGSGVSAADAAAWTAGASLLAPTGGVFNDSATALTSGQEGTVRLTADRMLFANLGKVGNTTTDTNSGTKSAGTLRVVLATDQPALTNKLLVTPDSVALPANQSVNVSQVNGVTVLTGVGAAGTGTQRVVDVASGTTGAAPPTQAAYIGGLQSGATGGFLGGYAACDLSKAINISTATTTLMVTGVSGRQVRICSFHMVTALANNVAWIEGTGATCGTGTTGMAGGTTAASGYNFAANGGIAIGTGVGEVLATTTVADSVCLITSAATQLSGFIKYTIY